MSLILPGITDLLQYTHAETSIASCMYLITGCMQCDDDSAANGFQGIG